MFGATFLSLWMRRSQAAEAVEIAYSSIWICLAYKSRFPWYYIRNVPGFCWHLDYKPGVSTLSTILPMEPFWYLENVKTSYFVNGPVMCSSAMINDGLTDIILLPRQHQGDHPGGALGATTDILPILPPNSPLDKPPFVHRPATDRRQPRVITCSRKCHPSFGWLQRTTATQYWPKLLLRKRSQST